MNQSRKVPNCLNKANGFSHEIESVWYLLYRFLWPFQYFQDVTHGNHRQQQLSYQHNRSMRFCLPGFMLKWSALSMICFAWGSFLDGQFSFTLLVAACFVAGCLTLIVVVLLSVGWMWLEH